MATKTQKRAGVWEWIDDRWHLDGRPVHAGANMQICWPDGEWEVVRIESSNAGKFLYAYFDHHGLDVAVRITPEHPGACSNSEIRGFRW